MRIDQKLASKIFWKKSSIAFYLMRKKIGRSQTWAEILDIYRKELGTDSHVKTARFNVQSALDNINIRRDLTLEQALERLYWEGMEDALDFLIPLLEYADEQELPVSAKKLERYVKDMALSPVLLAVRQDIKAAAGFDKPESN